MAGQGPVQISHPCHDASWRVPHTKVQNNLTFAAGRVAKERIVEWCQEQMQGSSGWANGTNTKLCMHAPVHRIKGVCTCADALQELFEGDMAVHVGIQHCLHTQRKHHHQKDT